VNKELFEMFEEYLRSQGLQAQGGQIIDATLVPVPRSAIPAMRIRKLRMGGCQKDGTKTQTACGRGT
jgi:IS5 family transposase